MRRNEVKNLTIGNVRFTDNKYVLEFRGKENKPKMCLIPHEVVYMIDEYITMRGLDHTYSDYPLFTSHDRSSIYQTDKFMSEMAIQKMITESIKGAVADL